MAGFPIPSLTSRSAAQSANDVYNASPFLVGSGSLSAPTTNQAGNGSFQASGSENLWPIIALIGIGAAAVVFMR